MDHLFVVVFALIYPIVGFIGYRRLLKKFEADIPVNRKQLYNHTIIWHWILFVLALVVWAMSGRDWALLGVRFDVDVRFMSAVALSIAAIVLLFLQFRQVSNASEQDVTRLKAEFGQVALIMPQNGSELMQFNMLSITAGIVEETLWRGYLIWYLVQIMPVWTAAIISAVGFGIAHSYQGLANVPKIILVGAIFTGLYVLSGSLWLPIILHAAVDLLQGRLAYKLLRQRSPAN